MTKRLTRTKVRRGLYEVVIDGVPVGCITGSARTRRIRPRFIVVDEKKWSVKPDPDRAGLWFGPWLLDECVEALCDMQGLPGSIAWALSRSDVDVSAGENEWIARFLSGGGFRTPTDYKRWVQEWQSKHLDTKGSGAR